MFLSAFYVITVFVRHQTLHVDQDVYRHIVIENTITT